MTPRLEQQMVEELGALAERRPVTTINVGTIDAWMVIAVLQLALRHPGLQGATREAAERMKNALVGAIATTPALAAVATMGDDPRFDH